MKYKFSYLVDVQYLGFRFHGWQKQPDIKTVHLMIDKTLKFIYKGIRFKSLGVGRTDARVSANYYAFQFFIDAEINFNEFLQNFNLNSPGDIRALAIKNIDRDFNVISHPKIKEYRYYFSFGTKNHPYSAPFITGYLHDFNIDLMKKGAALFVGVQNFKKYCTKPTEETKVVREIISCVIEKNDDLKANFFPKESYVLKIRGEGFLRNQIRLIMGTLSDLGSGKVDLDFIKDSLDPNSELEFIRNIAPASGLHLHKIDFIE